VPPPPPNHDRSAVLAPPAVAPASSQAGPAGSAGSLARNRLLLGNFYRRELFGRYIGSITGLAWGLLHPLALLAVYHVVFTTIFRTGRFDGHSFLAFVAIGLWPWLAAQESLQRAAVSVLNYAGLIRKVAFPHELIVYASVLGTMTLHLAGYLLVLVVLLAVGEPIHLAGLALALPLWCVMVVAVIGLALALAALQVFLRDVEHVLMPLLMIGMYLTPILYPLTLVPASLRPWVAANPFAWLVGRLRDALLDGKLAPHPVDAVAVAVALLLFFGGRAMFRRLSPHFEDFL
jgi:ABC-type polysaccharide/polyol phosphate export permease